MSINTSKNQEDFSYSDLLLKNTELLLEIRSLREQNRILVEKLNQRLKHPTPSLEEMFEQYEAVKTECELNRQRFVWAMMANNKTEKDLPKDEELPFVTRE